VISSYGQQGGDEKLSLEKGLGEEEEEKEKEEEEEEKENFF
jgi:hypothetical protein